MTICNMSIEGGARVGYVNPDRDDVRLPEGPAVRAVGRRVRARAARGGRRSRRIRTRATTTTSMIQAEELTPVVTWGVNPGQSVAVDGRVPSPRDAGAERAGGHRRARLHGARARRSRLPACASTSRSSAPAPTRGCRTCARPRASSRGRHVAPHVKALVVPGSASVEARSRARRARRDLPRRPASNGAAPAARCASGMNPDKLEGNQVCAASSNRNFKGRQGSPTGRTLLMSPAMVARRPARGGRGDRRAGTRSAKSDRR